MAKMYKKLKNGRYKVRSKVTGKWLKRTYPSKYSMFRAGHTSQLRSQRKRHKGRRK